MTREQGSHRCSCTGAVSCCQPIGLALQSESPTVAPRLAKVFRASEKHPGVFIADGPGFLAAVENVLAPLSQMERASLRAAIVSKGGSFDPWASGPAEKMLRRVRTPWLPELINTGAIRFDYQPIVHASTLRVFGHEALVRSAPPLRMYAPDELIDAAKAHDALLNFDQLCRRSAVESGFPRLKGDEHLFVNFLPMTVYNPEVCLRTTFEAAKRVGASFDRVVFEIVESEAFPDIQHLRAIVDVYRRRGAKVALDDLGAGATALQYVSEIRPDFVKLDRSLVARAAAEKEVEIVVGLVRHAQRLGIRVVAEGVETPQEMALMQRCGVDFLQGWAIARPSAAPVHEVSRRADAA